MFIYFMTVSKNTSKEIVSNIFNALDNNNYVQKKNNICHIVYILWRTDNCSELMVLPNVV